MQTVGVYYRCSAGEHGIGGQRADLELWCSISGAKCIWFEDACAATGSPGPALEYLLDDVHHERLATILVWRLDRLGLDRCRLLDLLQELQARAVDLVSVVDNVDLASPAGLGAIAALQSLDRIDGELRRDRCRVGIAKKRASGKRWGGSGAGQRKVVTTEQREAIRLLDIANMERASIARALDLSRPTVYKILGNGHAVAADDPAD